MEKGSRGCASQLCCGVLRQFCFQIPLEILVDFSLFFLPLPQWRGSASIDFYPFPEVFSLYSL